MEFMTDLFQEPPINPDDTHPTQTMPQVLLNHRPHGVSMWRRAVGFFSLLGAVGFTIGAVVVLISADNNSSDSTTVPATQVSTQVAVQTSPESPPTDIPVATAVPQNAVQPIVATEIIATLDPQIVDSLLVNPVQMVSDTTGIQVQAQRLDPFTIIPDRPRNEIINYTVVQGDTIRSIAGRFSLEPETIAWSNDRRIIQVLRPGDILYIPPVNGVLITAVGTTSIGEYASRYKIDDPYVVIDSPFNNGLFGLTPESVPPIGSRIFFPGGEGEPITWTPAVVREGDDGSGSGGNFISFAPGQAGSCGRVANPGGGAAWSRPIGPHTLTQGFSTWHTGIDYAANEGSPVYAANGGRVIFAGWNSFGYGYTVVLAHGPFTTLYGHLSAYNVSCGQDVAPGQQIASVGNSGNSSGPHLHFELRYLDSPTNPAVTIP